VGGCRIAETDRGRHPPMAKTVVVGRVADIPDGGAVTVRGPGKQIAIFRVGDQVYAIDDMCPHAGASLAGGFVENGVVTCPWHYWRFRLADGAWADNPRIKTGCYPVRVVDGEVHLEVPDDPAPPRAVPVVD
jgi:nitrite reductase (NADH) small subunit